MEKNKSWSHKVTKLCWQTLKRYQSKIVTKTKMHFCQTNKLNHNHLPNFLVFSSKLFHSDLTSGSWTATRPRALRWGSGRSGPGSLSSTHACSPRCRTRRGVGQSSHPPPPLESAGPRSGTSWAAVVRDYREQRIKMIEEREFGNVIWAINQNRKQWEEKQENSFCLLLPLKTQFY